MTRIFTEEHRRKIGLAHLGKKLSPEHRLKVIQTLKPGLGFKKGNKLGLGRKLSKESIERMRNSLKGKIPWNKGTIGAQVGVRGKKHWNWQGGKIILKERLRKTPEYRIWRDKVYHRDHYTCQKCGKKGGKLQVDHYPKSFALLLREEKITTIKKALSCPKLWDVSIGRVLCLECHKETDTYLKNIK